MLRTFVSTCMLLSASAGRRVSKLRRLSRLHRRARTAQFLGFKPRAAAG
jgi:hypothetical protein